MKKAVKKESKKNIEILNAKGETVHTLRDVKSSDVTKLRRDFYRVLVFKLKQKMQFKVKKAS